MAAVFFPRGLLLRECETVVRRIDNCPAGRNQIVFEPAMSTVSGSSSGQVGSALRRTAPLANGGVHAHD